MDDRGRLAQPLKGMARLRSRIAPHAALRTATNADHARPAGPRLARIVNRWTVLLNTHVPRGLGLATTAVVILASIAYGVVKGDHVPTVVAALKDVRD